MIEVSIGENRFQPMCVLRGRTSNAKGIISKRLIRFSSKMERSRAKSDSTKSIKVQTLGDNFGRALGLNPRPSS